jgi:hypothetical protein
LKVAVIAVTVLLCLSLVALLRKRPRLHGRLNTLFFILTIATLIGFEVVVRVINPNLTEEFTAEQHEALAIHLRFAVPAAILLPVMLYTGLRRHKSFHLLTAAVFIVLWGGTFVSGVFFLPHSFANTP